MADLMLGLTVISANDLEEVTSGMQVGAVVSLSGDPHSRQHIAADRTGGRNPTWNATLYVTVPATGDGSLHVHLSDERAAGSRDVGEVDIPLSELLSGAPDGPVLVKFVAYQVRNISSGKPQGVLNLSYMLGEVTQSSAYAGGAAQAAYAQPTPAAVYPRPSGYPAAGMPAMAGEPVTRYPAGAPYAAPPPQYGYAYPALAPQYGYAYPSAGMLAMAAAGPSAATAYAAQLQQYGYTYPAAALQYGYAYQPQAVNNNLGMMRLLTRVARVLGGMALAPGSGFDLPTYP